MSTSTDVVRLEVVDRVARITVDRPHTRNAMDWAVLDGLRDSAARVAAADPAAGPGAIRRGPRLLRDDLDRPRDQALAAEARARLACMAGLDVAAAAAAARDGRTPQFVGR